MDGNVFVYEAAVVETLGPTDVEEMHSGDWDLTLFTCTVGGRSRVTVRFNRVEAQIQPIGLNEN
jgi:sortase A